MSKEDFAAAQRERNRKSREGSIAGIKNIFDVQEGPSVNEVGLGQQALDKPALFQSGDIPIIENGERGLAGVTEEQSKSPELTGAPPPSPWQRPRAVSVNTNPLRSAAPGSGSAGFSGSVEGTVGPSIPGELTAAQMAFLGRQAQVAKLGLQAQADALGLQFDVAGELDALWESDFESTKQQVDGLLKQAETEAEVIRDLVDLSRGDQINPGQFFANIGGAGRFAAAMAAGVGAMATAFGGGPNAALGIIESAIDRNVRAQLANQQHNRALIAHQTNFVNTLRGLAANRAEYANWLRLGYTAIAKGRYAQIAAGLGQTQALLAKQDVDNKLGALLVDQQIKAIMASQQKVTFKFKTMAQYSQALRALGGQAPTGGAPLAGRAAKRGPVDTKGLQSAAQSGDINQVTAEFKRMSDAGVPEAQLKQYQDALVSQLGQGTEQQQALAQQLAGQGRGELLSLSQLPTTNLSFAGQSATAVTDDTFDQLSGNEKAKAKRRVSSAARAYVYGLDIMNLLSVGSFGTKQAYTRHIRNYLGDSYLTPARSPDAAKVLAEIQRKALAIEEAGREQDGTRNSINTAAEIARQAERWGTSVTLGEALVNFFWNDSKLRQARFESTIEILKDNLDQVQTDNGIHIQWEQ